MNRNVLSLVVGALIVVVAVLGYTVYKDRQPSDGVQISVGKNGVELKGN